MTHRLLTPLLAAAALLGLSLVPSARAASPINCQASALRLAAGTAPAVEPAVANRGSSSCVNASSPTQVDLGAIPVSGGVVAAYTFGGGANDQQKGFAEGGVANLSLGNLNGVQLPDLSALVPNIPAITVPLTNLPTGLLPIGLPVPTSVSIDVTAAVKALAKSIAASNASLLSLGTVNAFAGASCAGGKLQRFGAPQVAGVSVLGQNLDATGPVDTVLQAFTTGTIDPSKIDISTLTLPAPLNTLPLSTVQGLLQPLLDAIPDIQIPPALDVKLTPGTQTDTGGVLTQHALDVHIALAGQTLLDGTIGEAQISTGGVDCSAPASTPQAPAQPDATQLTLQCTSRSLVLTDVLPRNGRVRLVGAADKKYAGRTVAIRFAATGKTVAHAKIGSDGAFTTTAATPAKRLRHTNAARYTAVLGSKKSLDLKLERRMTVTSMSAKDGKVTIKGHVTAPLGRPVQKIRVQRRVSCKRNETVKSVTPHKDGSFAVTVAGPSGQAAAVYRLATKVRNNTRNRKLFDTFTLPRGINLKQR